MRSPEPATASVSGSQPVTPVSVAPYTQVRPSTVFTALWAAVKVFGHISVSITLPEGLAYTLAPAFAVARTRSVSL